MNLSAKNLLLNLGIFCSLYVAFAIYAWSLVTHEQLPYVDTEYSHLSPYHTEPKYFVWNLHKFKSDAKKVIIVGASNSRDGFRPEHMSKYLPGYEIHNAALAASEIKEIVKTTKLVLEKIPKPKRSETVFVYGAFFGNFLETSWGFNAGLTNVEVEQLRYGLYEISGQEIVPQIWDPLMPSLEEFLRPFAIVDTYIKPKIQPSLDSIASILRSGWQDIRKIRELWVKQFPQNSSPEPSAKIKASPKDSAIVDAKKYAVQDEYIRQENDPPEEKMQSYLEFWRTFVNTKDHTVPDHQLKYIEDLANVVLSAGAKFVIADIPSPLWMKTRNLHYANYQQKKNNYFNPILANEHAYYVDLAGIDDPKNYTDSSHPTAEGAMMWSEQLANFISNSVITK